MLMVHRSLSWSFHLGSEVAPCSLIRTVLQLDNIRASKLETTCWGWLISLSSCLWPDWLSTTTSTTSPILLQFVNLHLFTSSDPSQAGDLSYLSLLTALSRTLERRKGFLNSKEFNCWWPSIWLCNYRLLFIVAEKEWDETFYGNTKMVNFLDLEFKLKKTLNTKWKSEKIIHNGEEMGQKCQTFVEEDVTECLRVSPVPALYCS